MLAMRQHLRDRMPLRPQTALTRNRLQLPHFRIDQLTFAFSERADRLKQLQNTAVAVLGLNIWPQPLLGKTRRIPASSQSPDAHSRGT
jgi:hypothetical protein